MIMLTTADLLIFWVSITLRVWMGWLVSQKEVFRMSNFSSIEKDLAVNTNTPGTQVQHTLGIHTVSVKEFRQVPGRYATNADTSVQTLLPDLLHIVFELDGVERFVSATPAYLPTVARVLYTAIKQHRGEEVKRLDESKINMAVVNAIYQDFKQLNLPINIVVYQREGEKFQRFQLTTKSSNDESHKPVAKSYIVW